MITARYRKRPVIIETVQWTGGAALAESIIEWVRSHGSTATYREAEDRGLWTYPELIAIGTLEGTMHASVNDWIVRGFKNEFYPVKPDIFSETYDFVEGGVSAEEEIAQAGMHEAQIAVAIVRNQRDAAYVEIEKLNIKSVRAVKAAYRQGLDDAAAILRRGAEHLVDDAVRLALLAWARDIVNHKDPAETTEP